MPFNFGFGSSKGKQSGTSSGTYAGVDDSSQNTNFTTAPTNPQWEGDLAGHLGGQIDTLSGADPHSFIAGANPLLRTAANAAGDLNGTPWSYDAATDVTRGVANGAVPNIASKIGKFMDPYLGSVVDATSADLDRSDNIARQQSDLSNPAAFGGSGIALTKGNLEDVLSRARGTTLGGLRSHGYETALGGATAQAGFDDAAQNRRLAAGGQLAGIADQYGNNLRSNIATQVGAAQPIQSIDQANAQAPLDFQTFLSQVFSGLPLGLFQGQTGTENQTGTETQSGTTSGTTTGNSSGSNFGFGFNSK